MDIVVDTSSVIAVIIEEPTKNGILEITAGCSLVAPMSLRFEMGNALSKMMKMGRLTSGNAKKAFACYELIPIRHVPSNMVNALEISAKYNIYAYDAYMLEISYRLGLPLLTLDVPLSKIAANAGIRIMPI